MSSSSSQDSPGLPYALRNAVFHFHRVLGDTIELAKRLLAALPGHWETPTDGRKLVLRGEGVLSAEQIALVREIVHVLGVQAAWASMIEECIGGERRLFFVGPSDTAIGIMRRAYLEKEYRAFAHAVKALFAAHPELLSMELHIDTDGRNEWLHLRELHWASAVSGRPESSELLESLIDDGLEIDLRLVDGRVFRREDATPAAAAHPDQRVAASSGV